MVWPGTQEYNIAVENMDRFVLVPSLKGGKAKMKTQGSWSRPLVYSGGYCRVYPIEMADKTIALRCWQREIGKARERYQKIAQHFSANPLSYFVDVEFFDEGIMAGGKKYPVVCMEWVDGSPLNRFLDEHVHNSTLVLRLAEAFKKMVERLHQHGIAHGDLQDGNILVRKNGGSGSIELKLVDYDSLFIPSLEGSPSEILGLPDYQHPKRGEVKLANEKMDYFSELVIYLSLRAYAKDPTLWQQKQEQEQKQEQKQKQKQKTPFSVVNYTTSSKEQEKKLLFSAEDFQDPAKSSIFQTLKKMSPDIRHLAEQLEKFCLTDDINKLCRLEEVLPPNRPIADSEGLDWKIFKDNILDWEPSSPENNEQNGTGTDQDDERTNEELPQPDQPAPLSQPNKRGELFTGFFISAGVCVLGVFVLSAGQIGEAALLIALGTGIAGVIAIICLMAALASSDK